MLVPWDIFSDPFFANNDARVGRWVNLWCFAVRKKDARYYAVCDDDTELALMCGWLVRVRGRLQLTGPRKERRWLADTKREVMATAGMKLSSRRG